MTTSPKVFDFYAAFSDLIAQVIKGSRQLNVLLKDMPGSEAHLKEIRATEHAGDDIVSDIMEYLNRTFITPLEREDIHRLTATLDDILDMIYAAAGRVVVYQPAKIPDYVHSMGALVERCAVEIEKAIVLLVDKKKRQQILEHCKVVDQIENDADEQLRSALRELFANERDPIELIKIKETLENLEDATDSCESVAHALEGIVLKHS